jgi:peroxin-19
MDEIFKQFTSFLKDQEGEGDSSFKGALDSVVNEIISKDSLYKPMKNLKEEYPKWLEDHWQELSDEDLERYNKQLDKVTEICALFELAEKENRKPQEEVFELLSQL